MHYGFPKIWYGVPSEYREKVKQLSNKLYPKENNICKEFLRHKTSFISPRVMASHNILVYTAIQKPNE